METTITQTEEKKVTLSQDDIDNAPKTTGEKFYDILQFTIGKAVILVFTAAIAYVARYGKDTYGGIPNVLKKFQQSMEKWLLTNKTFPMGEGDFAKRTAEAIAGTTVLMHGGNLFAPIMKWLENNRDRIVAYGNKTWDKPGELEIGNERTKDLPKQTWGDLIKGRIFSWFVVAVSFLAIDTLVGKDKQTGEYRFDRYSDWFGKFTAGFTKKGKEISKMTSGMHEAYEANNTYRFGKILALDVYATSAAILIWNFFSRSSAQKRHDKLHAAQAEENISVKDTRVETIETTESPATNFGAMVGKKAAPAPSQSHMAGVASTRAQTSPAM